MLSQKVQFEQLEAKLASVIESPEYEKLINKIKACKRIYLVGNGGLDFVAAHATTDCTRLIPGKAFFANTSSGFLTSNANDHGFENSFTRWLDSVSEGIDIAQETMIVGLSCSGNSANVMKALEWGNDRGYKTFMISGIKSEKLRPGIDEIVYGGEFFHTVEVLTLMLFYDVIHQLDSTCPTIRKEIKRKAG